MDKMCKYNGDDNHQTDDRYKSTSDTKQAIVDPKCSSLQEFNWIKICNNLAMSDLSKKKKTHRPVRGKRTENSEKNRS